MTQPPAIIDLGKVIEPYLNGQKLVSYSSRYLTKPGDNYGSVMLEICANVRKADWTIDKLDLVAKLPPLTSAELWNLFTPEITCLRENAIYLNVSPSVRQLQLDSGIPESEVVELFAKFYGCRISLDEKATKLDRDAVLVVENLQCRGFKAGKRQIMFDYDHIRLVLKYVAKFHAFPIALKNKRPKIFEEDILTKFETYDVCEEVKTEIRDMCKEVKLALGEDIKAIKRYEELDEAFHEYMTNPMCWKDHNIFTTIVHLDLWINNIMILYDETSGGRTPIKLKIVDFQTCQLESLAHDLVFLFFASVKTEVLEDHFDDLLKLYFDEFIECLKTMLCDTSEYSYDKFIQEIRRIAPMQIPRAMFMTKVVMAEDKDLSEEMDIKTLHCPSSPAVHQKFRDIVRLSQKFGLFW